MCNDKMILFYGLDKERKELFLQLVHKYKLPPIKEIKQDMINMTVKDLIDGLMFIIYEKNSLQEEIILFNNLDDVEVDAAVRIINNIMGDKPILAVVTPTSIEWKFKDLAQHLIEERQWFQLNDK